MKAVILDGHTINPGDLSWKPIEDLCDELTDYDKTEPDDIIDRATDCEILMTSKCQITEDILDALPDLKYIGETATGYNNIDVAAAARRGVAVTNVPAYSTEAVCQHTIALLLELTNSVGIHDRDVHDGGWTGSEFFCYWLKPASLLSGKSLGIIGYGTIGKRVAEVVRALGMTINIYSRDPGSVMGSDFISLHCPLTEDNAGMINEEFLSRMKEGSCLINTARCGLIDEQALAEALNSGHLAGAAVDVLSSEPPGKDNPLLSARNCIITPHIAWVPRETRQKVIDILAENLKTWLEGGTMNRIDIRS